MRNLLLTVALFVILATPALADTVLHGETRYENVLVRETARMLYLQIPASGEIIHLRKDQEPTPEWIPASKTVRAKLQASWEQNRATEGQPNPSASSRPLLNRTAEVAASEREEERIPTLQLRGNLSEQEPATGSVQSIRLRDVSLAQALDAMLRPLGLDYEIRGNVVFISRPAILRQEAWEDVETRVYQVASQYETLPKIILRNPFAQGAVGGGFGGGLQQQGFGGGFGGLGAGQQGFGNAGGRFGGGGFGQQGFGGGFGGGGFGQQGGFNQGRLSPDVTQISNISELFSNIDDRMVGESPALVGGTSLRALRGTTRR